MKLKIGDHFKRTDETDGMKVDFIVEEINEEKNTVMVFCMTDSTDWEEEWDDLDSVYNGFEIGEYEMVESKNQPEEKEVTYNIVNPYSFLNDNQGYCVPEQKKLPPYKQKGFMRRRR